MGLREVIKLQRVQRSIVAGWALVTSEQTGSLERLSSASLERSIAGSREAQAGGWLVERLESV